MRGSATDRQRDLRLDALCDLALWAAIPAAVFSITARSLDIPFAGPLTLVGLLFGMVPLLGRGVWLALVALLAVLDTASSTPPAFERAARCLVLQWSGGPRAHLTRVLMLGLGLILAGLAGLVLALALSPLRRAFRTRWQRRWVVGSVAGPRLLALAVMPAITIPVRDIEQPLPQRDTVALPTAAAGRVVPFVHGLGEASGRPGDFDALFGPLRATFGEDGVRDASFYQDLSDRVPHSRTCRPSGVTLQASDVPVDVHGMPIDQSTLGRDKCDSESDPGLKALRLSEQVEQLHRATGSRVFLTGTRWAGRSCGDCSRCRRYVTMGWSRATSTAWSCFTPSPRARCSPATAGASQAYRCSET